MKSVEILVREHEVILAMLDNLTIARTMLEKREPPPTEFFEKASGFSRDFVDRFLHRLKTISPKMAAQLLLQTCAGLDYAHRKGITHRDINPANLFVQPDDRLKILDFGVACPIGTEDYLLGGALPYPSPELLDGAPPDERSDIYALGIAAYKMVTGQKPYPEEDARTLMKMHISKDIPDPSQINNDLPERLHRFILKACCRNPDERYQNAWEAIADISPLVRADAFRHPQPDDSARKTATVFLSSKTAKQEALRRLLKKFGKEAKNLGIDF